MGYPPGTLKWFKNDSYISSSTGLVKPNSNSILLQFSSLKEEDAGSYKCRIENSVGIQQKGFELLVLRECFI